VVRLNRLSDGLYVEPYAGGAAVACELLLTGLVRRIHINDLSRPVFAFWNSVLNHTDELTRLIADTPLDVDTWSKMKRTFASPMSASDLELGFATFYLNRTNRSGILNGGPIGGRAQTGQWGMDARFNRPELIDRITRIARARSRIKVTNLDATELLRSHPQAWTSKTLVYLDPPYFAKGPELYYNFYKHDDHAGVAEAVRNLKHVAWLVSYDDVSPIHELYSPESWLQYQIGYSARRRTQGREAMFFSSGLQIPSVQGSMIELERWSSASGEGFLSCAFRAGRVRAMIGTLQDLFWASFNQFVEHESDNVLKGTSEQNLCGRLALILERGAHEAGFEQYRADVEYNRKHEGEVKTILDEQLQVVRIIPDIILHSRGERVEDDNLIAIEMKRTAHRDSEKEKDRARLRALTKASYDGVWSADGVTHPEHVCGYKLGYYIELDSEARRFRIEEYQAGNQSDEREVEF